MNIISVALKSLSNKISHDHFCMTALKREFNLKRLVKYFEMFIQLNIHVFWRR